MSKALSLKLRDDIFTQVEEISRPAQADGEPEGPFILISSIGIAPQRRKERKEKHL